MSHRIDTFVASDRLPSLPQVALRVVELARQPEPDVAEICSVIRSDPALAGKVLKTVNSALFGVRGKVSSIEFAVTKLGLTLVRTLVLSFSLAERASDPRDSNGTLRRFWQAALAQAVFAETLAECEPDEDPAVYFLGGLLQSIGILAFLRVAPEQYESHVIQSSAFPCVAAAERRHFGFTHIDVGQRICSSWGLPAEFVDAMGRHQNFLESGQSGSNRKLVTALQAANLFALYLGTSHDAGHRRLDLLSCFLHERYEIEASQTEELIEDVCDRIGEIAAMFSFDVGNPIPTQRILEDAKHILAEIALQSQLETAAARLAGGAEPPARSWRRKSDIEFRDPLTGVYSRKSLQDVFNNRVIQHIQKQTAVGLLHVNVDEFRQIRDQYGAQGGDDVIQLVAGAISQAVRRADFVIRYGIDQFLVVLVRVTEDQVPRIAERICVGVRDARMPDGMELPITSSVGAIYYRPLQGDPLDANWLVQEVEHAMCEAKRCGGDQVRCYQFTGQGNVTCNG